MMELNPSTVIATIINFIGLLAILKYFFFGKVKAIIDEREALIAEQLDSAEEEQEKSRMLAIENERMLKTVREEGKRITEREKQKAEKRGKQKKRRRQTKCISESLIGRLAPGLKF